MLQQALAVAIVDFLVRGASPGFASTQPFGAASGPTVEADPALAAELAMMRSQATLQMLAMARGAGQPVRQHRPRGARPNRLPRLPPEASIRRAPADAWRPPDTPSNVDGRAETPPSANALVDRITARRIAPGDRAAFETIAAANARTEAGRPIYSRLRTTAGFPASFGRGQLIISEHLNELNRLNDDDLSQLGTSRAEIGRMRERGSAASGWYRAMHGGRVNGSCGLNAVETSELRRMVRARDFDGIERNFGARFAQETGLPASDVRSMAETTLLADSSLRRSWRETYRQMHGEAFDQRRRNPERMRQTTERMVQAHPELAGLQERLGSSSLGYYLGAGDLNENHAGWYGRAAANVVGRDRFDQMMRAADPVTTQLRHIRNFERASLAVRDAGLTGRERTETIGRLFRQFHGVPGATSRRFLSRGGPRYRSRGELLAALDATMAGSRRRQRSDDAFLRNLRAA